HGHLTHAPGLLLNAGPVVAVALAHDLLVEAVEPFQLHKHDCAGRSVAVMLAEMELECAARHLHVERRAGLEAVLPVEREAEEAEIEIPRLLDIEYPEHRHDALYRLSHDNFLHRFAEWRTHSMRGRRRARSTGGVRSANKTAP